MKTRKNVPIPFIYILIIFCCCIAQNGFSQTIIQPGPITGIWTATGQPYIITGDVYVLDSLFIEPGVHVQFQAGGWQLEVGKGKKLIAKGTANTPIIFEPFQGEISGSWNTISFNDTGHDDTVEYCVMRFGTEGIYVYDSAPKINDCIVYKNLTNGINLQYRHSVDSILVRNCKIHENGNGIRFTGYDRYGKVSVTGNIYRCSIYNNKQNGVMVTSGTYWTSGDAYALAEITNCTIYGNATGVRAYAYRGYADAKITNSIIAGCDSGVVNQDSRSFIGENDIIYSCFWDNNVDNFIGLKNPIIGFGPPLTTINVNGDSCDGNFNLFLDPLFSNAQDDDLYLRAASSCINAGTPIIMNSYFLDADNSLPDLGALWPPIQTNGDDLKPTIYNLLVEPNPTNGATEIILSATISDETTGNSHIVQAEYFIDTPGDPGTGISMMGTFTASSVNVMATILTSAIGPPPSTNKLYVRGMDASNNWSDLDSVTVWVTDAPVAENMVIPDTSAFAGSRITIPLRIKDAAGVAGAELKLTYDADILEAKAIHKTALTDSFFSEQNLSSGSCSITMARATALPPGGGIFLNVDFDVRDTAQSGDTTTIYFAVAKFYAENTNTITMTTKNGLFTVTDRTELVEIVVSPQSDTLALNTTLELTAVGKDAQGRNVTVTPDWRVESFYGDIGSVNPKQDATSTTFTASGAGDGVVIATQEGRSDSCIIVVGKTRGDINIDDRVDVKDAILGLQIIVEMFTPHLYQLWAADHGGDGLVLENDIQAILQDALGTMLPKTTLFSSPAFIYPGQAERRPDGLFSVPVFAQQRPDLAAGGLEVTYDAKQITPVAVHASRSSTLLMSNFSKEGTILVSSLDSETLIDREGVWMYLLFRRKSSAKITELHIKNIRLFDQAGQAISAELGYGSGLEAAQPEGFQLYQNHPNPFNPGTFIRYDLPVSGQVELAVYNTAGQLVQYLVNCQMPAGAHSAHWNGRDMTGRQAPSGVYFYRLTVDKGAWYKIQKMSLVK
ncbi:MAG TPA: cohesin domain-containing protein [bacterium]|nr:cohesin domain-containing protein [bacterium]HPG45252.1 cohesin domain-containing protein [bacterium]HPM99029.1 cohesin domain-containing protein [bacterium]